jgi:hypothetical protein
MRDTTGNLPLSPAIIPDTPAPVVRTAEDGLRELATMLGDAFACLHPEEPEDRSRRDERPERDLAALAALALS